VLWLDVCVHEAVELLGALAAVPCRLRQCVNFMLASFTCTCSLGCLHRVCALSCEFCVPFVSFALPPHLPCPTQAGWLLVFPAAVSAQLAQLHHESSTDARRCSRACGCWCWLLIQWILGEFFNLGAACLRTRFLRGTAPAAAPCVI
jgi:hypothetical protein